MSSVEVFESLLNNNVPTSQTAILVNDAIDSNVITTVKTTDIKSATVNNNVPTSKNSDVSQNCVNSAVLEQTVPQYDNIASTLTPNNHKMADSVPFADASASMATDPNSGYAPSKKCAVILDSTHDLLMDDYLRAIADIVGAHNIVYASKIGKNRLCVYLKTDEAVRILVRDQGIAVRGIFVTCRRYISTSVRVLLSSVIPDISNQDLLTELTKYGRIMSPIQNLHIGSSHADLKHVLSFRRVLYMSFKDNTELPESFQLTHDGTIYTIYISRGDITCHKCHQVGHVSRNCKVIANEKSFAHAVRGGKEAFPTLPLRPATRQTAPPLPPPPTTNFFPSFTDQASAHVISPCLPAAASSKIADNPPSASPQLEQAASNNDIAPAAVKIIQLKNHSDLKASESVTTIKATPASLEISASTGDIAQVQAGYENAVAASNNERTLQQSYSLSTPRLQATAGSEIADSLPPTTLQLSLALNSNNNDTAPPAVKISVATIDAKSVSFETSTPIDNIQQQVQTSSENVVAASDDEQTLLEDYPLTTSLSVSNDTEDVSDTICLKPFLPAKNKNVIYPITNVQVSALLTKVKGVKKPKAISRIVASFTDDIPGLIEILDDVFDTADRNEKVRIRRLQEFLRDPNKSMSYHS